jgi:hypothetical protein
MRAQARAKDAGDEIQAMLEAFGWSGHRVETACARMRATTSHPRLRLA